MIDAGYNYPRLKEKMGWLGLDPKDIGEVLLTHIDTGHTGWTDDLDFAFATKDKVIGLFTKVAPDPQAPYDGYDESGDTEEKARKGIPLPKKIALKDREGK